MTASDLKDLELHYLAPLLGSNTRGRGEFVRLMIIDAGLDFEYVRWSYEKWATQKEKLLADNVHAPTLPYIIVDGKYVGKTVPSMKFIAKKLGHYDGRTDEEVQLLDEYTDIFTDWTNYHINHFYKNFETDIYLNTRAPAFLKTFDDILSDNSTGPYILGDYISYVDFLLYHIIEEDETKVKAEEYPHIYQNIQAIESRPNLKKYLATDRA